MDNMTKKTHSMYRKIFLRSISIIFIPEKPLHVVTEGVVCHPWFSKTEQVGEHKLYYILCFIQGPFKQIIQV